MRATFVFLALSSGWLTMPPATLAQASSEDASERAAARLLFQEGVSLIDQEEWTEAVDRFRRALAITESPVGRFNLGHALTQLGRLVEASEQLRRVMTNADSPEAVRDATQERLTALEARFARLTVRVEGASDVEVTRNGETVPAAIFGVATPVDPGEYVVAVTRGEVTLEERTITLGEGQSDQVSFTVEAAIDVPAVPDDPGGQIGPILEPPPREVWEEWWLWTIVGVVVVGAVLGITLGVTLTSEQPCEGDFMPCRLDLP